MERVLNRELWATESSHLSIVCKAGGSFPNQRDAPNSLNQFLGNFDSSKSLAPVPNLGGFTSSRLQFNPVKYLFIKSSNLGTFNTLGSFGERTILKKVPVVAPQGEMILDDTRSGNDFLECGKQTLKRFGFTITDERGSIPDLHEHDVSFSLMFSIMYVSFLLIL